MTIRPSAAAIALLLLCATPAGAQQHERTPTPVGERANGYLTGEEFSIGQWLAQPPPLGSLEDDLDVAAVKTLQARVTPERWDQAVRDDRWIYPEFEAAFGGPIDREHSPALVHLLNESLRDAARVSSSGKKLFLRPRPYQRFQVARLCGEATAPAPDPDPKVRSSYPSGHTTVGWTTALILAEVAPDRAEAIMARGREYALSRVICAWHYPSDTAAGRQVASAVVSRLQTVPAFQADLAAARAEHAKQAKP